MSDVLPLDVLGEISLCVDGDCLIKMFLLNKQVNQRLNVDYLWMRRVLTWYPGCTQNNLQNFMSYREIFIAHQRYTFINTEDNKYIDTEFNEEMLRYGPRPRLVNDNTPFVVFNIFKYDDAKILAYYYSLYHIRYMTLFLNKHYILMRTNILKFISSLSSYKSGESTKYIIPIFTKMMGYYLNTSNSYLVINSGNFIDDISVKPLEYVGEECNTKSRTIHRFLGGKEAIITHLDFVLDLHPWLIQDQTVIDFIILSKGLERTDKEIFKHLVKKMN